MGIAQSSFLSDGGANSGYHVHGVCRLRLEGQVACNVTAARRLNYPS